MKFSDRMKDILDKGVAVSRDFAAKAGEQAQVWGEMGVLKIEILQLQSEAERLSTELGALVYARFVEQSQTELSSGDAEVRQLLGAIRRTEVAMNEKEDRFRQLGGRDSDLERKN